MSASQSKPNADLDGNVGESYIRQQISYQQYHRTRRYYIRMDGTTPNSATDVRCSISLNAIQTAAAVLGLRREIPGATQRWTLGTHGSFELDSQFVGLTLKAQPQPGWQRIATTGRLWSADGMAVAGIEFALESALAPPTLLVISPTAALPPTFANDLAAYHALAQAALSELTQELQYHAAAVRRQNSAAA